MFGVEEPELFDGEGTTAELEEAAAMMATKQLHVSLTRHVIKWRENHGKRAGQRRRDFVWREGTEVKWYVSAHRQYIR